MLDEKMKGLSTHEREIISKLTALELQTVTTSSLIEHAGLKRQKANQVLSQLYRKGWLRRLKRGLYSIVPLSSESLNSAIENSWLLAMDIFRPSYISGWSAAEHWDLTEQIFNSVSVVTASSIRSTEQKIAGVNFRLKHVDDMQLLLGIEKSWFGSVPVSIANPERLIIDILDMPSFGGGGRHMADVVKNYWRSDKKDAEKLLDYALAYKKGVVFKRLGFLAEVFSAPVPKSWLIACENNVSKGISNLDPDGPDRGSIVTRWNLRINIPITD